jgi:centrosomal protein CEP104
VHQNKIPSRIELYAYAPDFTSLGAANLVSPNNQNISFARLGHFSLDDNIRTNYQARELKTVYLEQYCQYLKIVIHKNHLNSLNIFNQVGLVSLTCTGSYIGDYEMSAVQQRVGSDMPSQVSNNPAQLMPRNLKIAGVNEEELDASVQEKIRVLSEAKIKAVDEEDFDKAKYLKDAIDKLKLAGSQLVQLEV